MKQFTPCLQLRFYRPGSVLNEAVTMIIFGVIDLIQNDKQILSCDKPVMIGEEPFLLGIKSPY
jgi:hypothetical protein